MLSANINSQQSQGIQHLTSPKASTRKQTPDATEPTENVVEIP